MTLGKSPISPSDLISRLHRHKLTDTRTDTQELLRFLSDIGRAVHVESRTETTSGLEDFSVFYNDPDRERKAFLLDFLWWKQGFGTLLAVESELSDKTEKGFQHDFEKLLCWKAPLKLMVVKEQKQEPVQIAKSLSAYARSNFEQFFPNETFVLFVFGNNENQAFVFTSAPTNETE